MKTLLIIGNGIGGTGSSTAAAHIVGSLRLRGYRVRLLDGDQVNQTVSQMDPTAELIDTKDLEKFESVLAGVPEYSHDFFVLDMPAASSHHFNEFFTSRPSNYFTALGVRLIVGVSIAQSDYSLRGAAKWVSSFPQNLEFLLIESRIGRPENDPIIRKELLTACGNRKITIPRIGRPRVHLIDPRQVLPTVKLHLEWLIGCRADH